MADSINYQLAKFVASYGKVSQIPESTCPEVSFVGRSNVGKSSIMNKLFGRKNLVKVSSTPGKTSNINFFEADDVHFVDLPGYGFARRSKAESQSELPEVKISAMAAVRLSVSAQPSDNHPEIR